MIPTYTAEDRRNAWASMTQEQRTGFRDFQHFDQWHVAIAEECKRLGLTPWGGLVAREITEEMQEWPVL